MRAPNGQSLPISPNKHYAILVGGDVLRRCVPQFEEAVTNRTSVTFELNEHDIFMLRQHYHEEVDSLSGHLFLFLNQALQERELPYGVRTVAVSLEAKLFCCRIERRAL